MRVGVHGRPRRRTTSAPGSGGQAGFTLLEAVVALAVIGLAVVGATEAASRTLRTQGEVTRRAEAAALADAALAETTLLERDSLERWSAPSVEAVRLDSREYRVATRARAASADRALWSLEASVTWAGGRLDLATLVYRPDPSPRSTGAPP